MYGHGADTRMTAVRMVEPIVVIGDVIGSGFGGHTAHRRLTCIPEMAIADGNVFGIAFDVYPAIAFGLIASFVRSIKHIDMMHPDMVVVGIE